MLKKILIKTPEQVECIRKSCELASMTLDYLQPLVQPGVSTNELNDKAAIFIKDHGATSACKGYRGFPKETCISINETICHGIPSDKRLKDGDIVKIDVTTILNGYYGDTCRTFEVGNISKEASDLISIAKSCLDMGIIQVKPHASFDSISEAITLYAESNGYSVVNQFCGHGTGIEFHEPPQLDHHHSPSSRYSKGFIFPIMEKMKVGMIFTIEPMINQGEPEGAILEDKWTAVTCDGKLSAQFEHTVVVVEDGFQILTTSGICCPNRLRV